MNKLKSLALAALAAFGLTAYGAEKTNEWWEVDFNSPTPNGVNLPEDQGGLGSLTNDAEHMAVTIDQQPYTNGVWIALEGDESCITNSFCATNTFKQFGDTACLKLDTQGNDLTWRPTAVESNLVSLVDADLYLVGSDSEPLITDFDSANDVQTAIYLKNELNAEGETTNSILCVYIYDDNLETNVWQELAGVPLDDNAWAHVQVIVDHSGDSPTVQVFVNGTAMHNRYGAKDFWTAANGQKSADAGRVSSVAFRGTGAIDNFVGLSVEKTVETFDFEAQVFMNNTMVQQGQSGNTSRTALDTPVGPTEVALFRGFSFHDYVEGVQEASFVLDKIVLINQGNGAETVIEYTYQDHQVSPTNSPAVVFGMEDVMDEDEETGDQVKVGERQSGTFDVLAPTAGATSNAVIAKIYFKTVGGSTAPAVDAGLDLDVYNADHAGEPGFTPVQPISFAAATPQDDPLCTISFVAPEAGWYFLYTNMTVTGTYRIDVGSKQEATVDSLVTLTETGANTAKFFKIGWAVTEPTTADPEPAE